MTRTQFQYRASGAIAELVPSAASWLCCRYGGASQPPTRTTAN